MVFPKFIKQVKTEKCLTIIFIISDHGGEFQNENLCKLFES